MNLFPNKMVYQPVNKEGSGVDLDKEIIILLFPSFFEQLLRK